MLQPTSLAIVEPSSLQIQWSDGVIQKTRIVVLREACPCATCREKKRADAGRPKNLLPVLTAGEAKPLGIVGMRPVGNYAYNIDFSDGHGSGLYTIEMLRSFHSD